MARMRGGICRVCTLDVRVGAHQIKTSVVEAARPKLTILSFAPGLAGPCSTARPPGFRCGGQRCVATGEKLRRVLRYAVDQHLEVQVRAGRPARGADLGDDLRALDQITRFHEHPCVVHIPRDQAVAVIDFDEVAVLWVVLARKHQPTGGGVPDSVGKSSPVCSAARSVNGSVRKPEPEPTPLSTGLLFGIIEATRRDSSRRDSSRVNTSMRWSVSMSSEVTTPFNWSSESVLPDANGTNGPPCPAAPPTEPLFGIALSSSGLTPAAAETRSLIDSSLMSLACTSPSRCVEVLAHETVALRELVTHDEPHQMADDRPALARSL